MLRRCTGRGRTRQVLLLVCAWAALCLWAVGAVAAAATAASDQHAVIHPRLASLLDNKGPDDTVWVIVALREKADLGSVWGQPREVLPALKAAANRGQKDLRPFLEQQRRMGRVKSYRTFWVFDGVAVECNAAVVTALAAHPEVESITEDYRLQIPPVGAPREGDNRLPGSASGAPQSAPGSGDVPPAVGAAQWNIDRVRAPEVWASGITGAGVVVGSIDTGVDYTHPDLATRWRGYPDDPVGNWFDAVGGQPMPYDDHGHGTHTTGTICGGDASGAGIGVAPGATWIAAKAFDAGGGGYVSTITACMEWVMDPNGDGDPSDAPRVVNNSWGNDNPYDTSFLPQVEAWLAAGIFPNFASGNAGPGSGTAGTPGNFEISFGVGATDSSDTICGFSSRGPAPEGPPWNGGIKPNVSAPGQDILSSFPGGGYYSWQGTSMATPHVTGAVALLLEANPSLSVAEVKTALTTSAVDLGPPGPDNDYGAGRLDCYAAVAQYAYPNRIGGHVQAWEGTPLAGALVTLSDGVNTFTLSTSEDGAFSRTVPDGTWTVTCEYAGYAFSPSFETVSVPPDAVELLFIGTASPGSLSGTITSELVTPTLVESPHPFPSYSDSTWVIAGTGTKIRAHFQYAQTSECRATIYLYDQYDQLVATYIGGQYGFWTPWVDGSALKVRMVSSCSSDPGFVIDSYATDGGGPMSDVTITLSPGGRTTTTGPDGTFTFSDVAPMTYSVTPSKVGRTFSPPYRTETVVAGAATTGVDFLGSRLPSYSVLLYDYNTYSGTAREAIGRLGYAYTRAGQSDFNTKLVSQPWSLVVVDCPSYKPSGGWMPVIDYINGGGKVALSTWYLTSEPELCAAFGVSALETYYWTPPIYRWETAHPLFTRPQTVSDMLYWSDYYWDMNADRLAVTSMDAQAVAGFSMYAETDMAALVIGNANRTIMNGFLWDDRDQDADWDGIQDCVELVMNEVQFLLARRLDVGRVGGPPGAVVTVPVSLSETQNLAGLQFDLEYVAPEGSPPLALTTVRGVGPLAGWIIEWNEVVPGQRLRVMAYSPDMSELPSGSGTLLELDFQIDAAATGERYPLQPISVILSDSFAERLEPVDAAAGEAAVLPSGYVFSLVETPQGGDLDSPLPFLVHIEAQNGAGGVMTGYTGTADLVSDVGTVVPATITFTGGVWEGDVVILAGLDPETYLQATDRDYPVVTGTSNTFNLRGKGDPTDDGAVNVLDVVRTVNLALRAPVTEPPRKAFQDWAADVNCSGLVNVQDVILVLRKSLGLPTVALSIQAVAPAGLQVSTRQKGAGTEVVVRVKDAVNLAGLQLTLTYDPKLLQLSEVKNGSLLAGWAVAHQAAAGQVRVLSYDPTAAGVTGTGSAVVLTFRTTGKGRAPVALSEATLSDTAGQVLPIIGGR